MPLALEYPKQKPMKTFTSINRISQLVFFVLILTNQCLLAETVNPPSQGVGSSIKKVTVYLIGAEITRESSLQLRSGLNTVVFEGLSPNIDESSIQIYGLGGTTIQSINYGINYLTEKKYSKKADSIEHRLAVVSQKKQRHQNSIQGLRKEEEILNNNQRLGSTTQEIDLTKVKELAAFYRQRITELHNTIFDINLKINMLSEEESALRKQLQEYNVSEEIQKGEITLKINSEINTSLTLTLSYKVSEAGWFPVYDISAIDTEQPLEVDYKAHVYQNTGISWEEVLVQLSTDDPTTNTTKPTMGPQYLNFVNPYTYKPKHRTQRHSYTYNPTVKRVNGVVLDETGLPLLGANIIVKGTSIGTTTDANGRYTLQVNEGQELVFSYVGFSTKEIPIHASTININLDTDDSLEEVLITAQGIQRDRKTYGYSVTEALEGSASGVQISQTSGSAGSGNNVIIRGYTSLTSSADALYIIDGIPSSADGLSLVDPNTIISTDVLKGLAATTLYGNEGRNGVVLITTKRGAITSEGLLIDQNLTSVRFTLTGTHTILSDDDIQVIKVDTFNVPATFEYLAAPVLNENTFLTAKIKQWEQYNLLPGEANIYFEGGYAGKTFINPLAITEELTISLGIDPNVTIERKEDNDFKSKSFIGGTKIVDKAYTITIKNNKTSAINLTLMDRIPISQNKEIKVNDINTGGGEFEDKTGLLSWKIQLDPEKSEEKRIGYTLRFPKHKTISL